MTAKTAAKGGFTPGPWKVIPEAGWVNVYRMYDEHYNIQPTTEDARRANGLLMTAAPQLYSLLQRILEILPADKVLIGTKGDVILADAQKLLEAIHG